MQQRNKWKNRLKPVVLGMGLALSTLTIRHWYETFTFGHPLCQDCRPDFPQFYAAARLIWESPSALYDEASQLAIQRTIDSRIGDSLLPYTYPPFTAVAFMPLGRLPFNAAFVAMTVLNTLLLAISLRLLTERLQLESEQSTWLKLTTFCNFGVHSVFLQGQASFILLSLLVWFTLSVDQRRSVGSGLSAGLMFIKPQLQVDPFILLLARPMWRALVIASSMVVVLAGFSVFLVGWVGISQYVSLLTTYLTVERGYGSYPEAMHNLRAVAQYAAPFAWSRYLWVALVLPVLTATFYINVRPSLNERTNAILWIGNFVASALITPHLYPHDLAILIIPAAFALKTFGSPVPVWLILLLVVLGVYPLLPLTFGNSLPPLVPLVLLIIFFACVRLLWRADRRSRKAQSPGAA